MAAEGMRFTRCYAASGVCSPSRAALLTGRYPLRFDIRRHFTSEMGTHLPPGIPTLPALFAQNGYHTAHVGKWHLGGLRREHATHRASSPPGPLQHGFHSYVAMIEAADPRGRLGGSRRMFRDGARHLLRDDQPADLSPRHLTDVEFDEAEAVLRRQRQSGQPFFIQLWLDVPHNPYEPAPEPHLSAAQGDALYYRSNLSHVDARLGQLRALLDKLRLTRDTLLLFTSDNGPTGPGIAAPLRGGKGTLFEGGIRVPLIACQPGTVPAGITSTAPCHHADLLPTLAAAAGLTPPPEGQLDGINLWPLDRLDALAVSRPPLLWQHDAYPAYQRERKEKAPHATEAAMQGKWKLLSQKAKPLALYDLEADPAEHTNLLTQHPEIATRLSKSVQTFLDAPRDSRGNGSAPAAKETE
jgi:N-acetylgalactosamine-6-sulfatase